MVMRVMFLAREKEAAAALVEPAEPSTPASDSTEIIHHLMVPLAAIDWGRSVVRNKLDGLLFECVRLMYSSKCKTGHNRSSAS